jgi:predicted Rossmann fold nucleotide-binding protein DprA/Smf involved in DNA uptake
MSLAVIGSRTFNDYNLLKETLEGYEGLEEIISGGATGADTLAERYAKEKGIPLRVFLPDWNKYGKAAGPIRNKLIVEASDHVVAFWDGISRGTKSSIDIANQLGKPIDIVRFQ